MDAKRPDVRESFDENPQPCHDEGPVGEPRQVWDPCLCDLVPRCALPCRRSCPLTDETSIAVCSRTEECVAPRWFAFPPCTVPFHLFVHVTIVCVILFVGVASYPFARVTRRSDTLFSRARSLLFVLLLAWLGFRSLSPLQSHL